jgi:hypothetical protein
MAKPTTQNQPVSQSELAAELAKVQAENTALRAELDATRIQLRELQPPPPGVLPEKYRGEKRYRVDGAGAYRQGRFYAAGDVITLVDEVPSRTWVPVVDVPAPVDGAPAPEGTGSRATDLSL